MFAFPDLTASGSVKLPPYLQGGFVWTLPPLNLCLLEILDWQVPPSPYPEHISDPPLPPWGWVGRPNQNNTSCGWGFGLGRTPPLPPFEEFLPCVYPPSPPPAGWGFFSAPGPPLPPSCSEGIIYRTCTPPSPLPPEGFEVQPFFPRPANLRLNL